MSDPDPGGDCIASSRAASSLLSGLCRKLRISGGGGQGPSGHLGGVSGEPGWQERRGKGGHEAGGPGSPLASAADADGQLERMRGGAAA